MDTFGNCGLYCVFKIDGGGKDGCQYFAMGHGGLLLKIVLLRHDCCCVIVFFQYTLMRPILSPFQ
jgi:hypothetical protein